ncbi:hypothetical protein PR729_26065 [Providencia rettgeri]|nr:hypothetical protein PR729_26065 [Providencia rettgeri]
MQKKIRDYTNENYESWADNEWERYLAHANENNIDEFKNDYNTQKNEYKSNYEIPLFDMYLAMLKHSLFINYFIYNFDANNKTSGENYTNTLSSCLIGSQVSAECADYIETQLNGDFLDKKKIFLCEPISLIKMMQLNFIKNISLNLPIIYNYIHCHGEIYYPSTANFYKISPKRLTLMIKLTH